MSNKLAERVGFSAAGIDAPWSRDRGVRVWRVSRIGAAEAAFEDHDAGADFAGHRTGRNRRS